MSKIHSIRNFQLDATDDEMEHPYRSKKEKNQLKSRKFKKKMFGKRENKNYQE